MAGGTSKTRFDWLTIFFYIALVGIGWVSLGGAKTHGQATSSGSNSGSGMSLMCKNAIASGDSGSINVHCH